MRGFGGRALCAVKRSVMKVGKSSVEDGFEKAAFERCL